MATVGQQLTAPEAGWKRYDDTALKYIGALWIRATAVSGDYNGTESYTNQQNNSYSFKFVGTKLRLIGTIANNRSTDISVTIDGITEQYSQYSASVLRQTLLYEKTGLTNNEHMVEVKLTGTNYLDVDAIDIDSTGRLLHPDEVTNLNSLSVGKYIRCNYTATSNQVGAFSRLGLETNDFLPATPTAAPNGDFYLVCVDKDHLGRWKLIADRNVQNAISWDTLNAAGVASGSGLPYKFSFTGNLCTGGTAISGGDKSGYPSSKAFDGGLTDPTMWKSSQSISISGVAWIGYDFGVPKQIGKIRLRQHASSAAYAVTSAIIQSSDDGVAWYSVRTVNNLPMYPSPYVSDDVIFLPASTPRRYWRLLANSNTTSDSWYVYEVEMMEEVQSDYNCTVRLPTGGLSLSDAENEWDKCIVSSPLNGAITAGDNFVWNWSGQYSWTSTTHADGNTLRTLRGSGASSTLSRTSSNVTTANLSGFRPMLVVESLVTAPTFTGSVDKTSVHSDNVVLSGTITDQGGQNVSYRILVNGVQVYPASGNTTPSASPVPVNYTVVNSLLTAGSNNISIYCTNGISEGSSVFTVTLNDAAPVITATMTGMRLDMSITDADGDTVQFNVKLNGTQVYPTDLSKQFTDLATAPINYTRVFSSSEAIVGASNTVLITAKDSLGVVSTATLTFTGTYVGLMFADQSGNFYSTDLGVILQYLDIGVLTAGQISLSYPIRLINMTGFPVTNIILSKDNKTLPSGATVEISKNDSPFTAESNLTYSTVMQYNDELTFYVRVVADLVSQPGQGEFDVLVIADPY